MSVIAISTGTSILALIGLAVGLGAALLVVKLFNLVMAPALEIDGYAKHILDAGVGIATNLDGVAELERTDALATAVPGLAGAYLQKIEGGAP